MAIGGERLNYHKIRNGQQFYSDLLLGKTLMLPPQLLQMHHASAIAMFKIYQPIFRRCFRQLTLDPFTTQNNVNPAAIMHEKIYNPAPYLSEDMGRQSLRYATSSLDNARARRIMNPIDWSATIVSVFMLTPEASAWAKRQKMTPVMLWNI